MYVYLGANIGLRIWSFGSSTPYRTPEEKLLGNITAVICVFNVAICNIMLSALPLHSPLLRKVPKVL